VAVADELHMSFECPALRTLRQQHAPLFSTDTNTMRSFFAQQDHMKVFKFVPSCLDVLQNLEKLQKLKFNVTFDFFYM